MKNKNKIIVISIITIVAVIALVIGTMQILKDENKLTVNEKQWINNNISTIQNINVINDVDILGKKSTGVFYDFITGIKNEYNLTINPITYNYKENEENLSSRAFKVVDELNDNELVFKDEHFVLVDIKNAKTDNINNLKIGITSEEENLIKKYINNPTTTFVIYENTTKLYEALSLNEEINYALIPLDEELSTILSNNYNIIMHFSDIKKYFVYEDTTNDEFSSIIKKYFSKYEEKELKDSINKNTLKTFVDALNINEKELKDIQAKEFNYGFVNNSPYEVLTGGTYGGIVSEYIQRFSEVSNTAFKFTKYKTHEAYVNAINNGELDLFFNFYNLETNYQTVGNGITITYDIITRNNNKVVINSIESLRNKEVYVLENSLLFNYLNKLGYVNVKTYKDDKALEKLIKKDVIIMMDKEIYDYYANTKLDNYIVKYTDKLDETYTFKTKEKDSFYLLFNKYISTLDNKEVISTGLYNHKVTVKNGTLAGTIAKYSLFLIAIIVALVIIAYKSSKKIKITKKIKKEDKLKYIDQLTSLKNRNYLSENIAAWNKNTIYPQAAIVIDLDEIQTINDTLGYEAGDEQIKSAANILIKTQLDNTDIIRTDGNEFLIYLVGYKQTQVASYIRKLYKEFKHLPYEHGATIGHSMILDDIKSIEDAINEAVEAMKEKKEEQ